MKYENLKVGNVVFVTDVWDHDDSDYAYYNSFVNKEVKIIKINKGNSCNYDCHSRRNCIEFQSITDELDITWTCYCKIKTLKGQEII